MQQMHRVSVYMQPEYTNVVVVPGQVMNSSTRPTEQACIGFVPSDRIEPVRDELPNFFDQRDGPGTVTLGAFVLHAARRGGCLTTHSPRPGVSVDIADTAAGHLADSGRRARSEDHHVTPSAVPICRTLNERISKRCQGCPVREREGPQVVEFVLDLLVQLLPATHPSRIGLPKPVPYCLFHHAHQYGKAVLHRRFPDAVADPADDHTVYRTVGQRRDRQMSQARYHPLAPTRASWISALLLQAPQRYISGPVFGECYGGPRNWPVGSIDEKSRAWFRVGRTL
ncbi:hypothetical protein [Nocardia testacea]|uniref:hypothetical protein n=1 Tax=Nocardia testacea TaxID=248551 RepID=UPI0012F6FD0E|nr:hypothetical protein [Nocardia testacea]